MHVYYGTVILLVGTYLKESIPYGSVHNILKIQMSINRWMDKEVMVHAHNGTLCSSENE